MIKKDWIKKVKSVHPKSDEQVLQFIYDFRTMQKSEAAEELTAPPDLSVRSSQDI